VFTVVRCSLLSLYCTDVQIILQIHLPKPDVRRQGTYTGTANLDVPAYIRMLAQIT